MESFKNEVARLRQRYKTLQQQQMTFVSGLDNSRTDQYERSKPLRSINEVKQLYDRSKNTRDRRAMLQWMNLLDELGSLQRKVEGSGTIEGSATKALERWKVLLNPNHDFSGLKAKYPHQEMNHLSCEEARVLYGGCVSLVPLLFDQVQKIYSDIRAKEDASAALQQSWPPPRRATSAAVHSATHRRSKTETQLPQRAQTALGQREIGVDTKDLSKRMLKLSFGRVPKGQDEPVLFYRRTLNGRADKLHANGEITLDKAPWRGASYDKINHVDHRRFVNLQGKYY